MVGNCCLAWLIISHMTRQISLRVCSVPHAITAQNGRSQRRCGCETALATGKIIPERWQGLHIDRRRESRGDRHRRLVRMRSINATFPSRARMTGRKGSASGLCRNPYPDRHQYRRTCHPDDVFTRLPQAKTPEDYEQLLPWKGIETVGTGSMLRKMVAYGMMAMRLPKINKEGSWEIG